MANDKTILDKIIEQTLKPKTVSDMMALPPDLEKAISKAISDPETLHNVLTVASIAALFIPLIGPAVSAGISLGNAGLYAKEGKGYEAGLEATFAIIPGLGKLAKMSGIAQLGKEGMKKLAGKLIAIKAGKQITLDATEKLALKTIAANKQVVETEVKKSLAKRVAAGTGKAVANIGSGVLTAAAYDKIYLNVAGTTLDEWLTKWWDDWLLNPIVESTNIYQDIANQIALNEQTTTLKNAAQNWDNETIPTTREEPQSGWDKTWDNVKSASSTVINNPIAQIVGAGLVSILLLRWGGKKLGRSIKNYISGGKLTTDGAKRVGAKLDAYGLKLLAKGLQETRDKIFKQVASGQMTRNAAMKFFTENGMLPKKYIGLGRERKKLETVLDNQITAGKGTKLIQKTQAKKAATTKKSIKPPTTVSYSYTNK